MDIVTVFVIVLVVVAFYLLPALVASYRKHPNTNAITVLNLLLGWSLFGWVVALVWACSAFSADASPSSNAATRACPFCAETIKAAALKCKHCGSDLPAASRQTPTT
jgi:hypothetical protein